jgi:acyl-CoA synthetase (AMP-forming)/AMP-acid ligase II
MKFPPKRLWVFMSIAVMLIALNFARAQQQSQNAAPNPYLKGTEGYDKGPRGLTSYQPIASGGGAQGTTDSAALSFCRARLADFKVPTTIWITSALPKNATGKLDRRKLPALFKSTSE